MKILLIGPFPNPITGNSIINKKILDNFQKYQKDIKTSHIDLSTPAFDSKFGEFHLRKFLSYLVQYKRIYRVFFADTVYVSIGHTFLGIVKYLPFFLFAKILNKLLIVHVHTDYIWVLYRDSNKAKRTILKKTLGLIDKGIVLSPPLKRNLSPFVDDSKIYSLPNFISKSLLDHDIEQTILKKNRQKLRILFLSNLIREKGIIDFLNALLILKKKQIDFEAHIAGAIPEYMKEEINEYFEELQDYVSYHGVVKGGRKKALFLLSNVFVFPTHSEAQGIVLLEAMATANVILSTCVGGIPYIFEANKNGYTINVNDPLNIATQIISLERSFAIHTDMLRNNYVKVKETYTEPLFFEKLHKIITT